MSRPQAYEYVTEWHLEAPLETVWDALTDVESWPRWWPHVRSVHRVRRGEASGVGDVRRLRWGSRLPYGFTLETSTVAIEHHSRIAGRTSGDLEGTGLWELERDGAGTRVRYTWRLELRSLWMRLVAPLMAPVFRWNHHAVMRDGGIGLARYLGAARQVDGRSSAASVT
jgi:carbon monoxide dehydrogenase subunit G